MFVRSFCKWQGFGGSPLSSHLMPPPGALARLPCMWWWDQSLWQGGCWRWLRDMSMVLQGHRGRWGLVSAEFPICRGQLAADMVTDTLLLWLPRSLQCVRGRGAVLRHLSIVTGFGFVALRFIPLQTALFPTAVHHFCNPHQTTFTADPSCLLWNPFPTPKTSCAPRCVAQCAGASCQQPLLYLTDPALSSLLLFCNLLFSLESRNIVLLRARGKPTSSLWKSPPDVRGRVKSPVMSQVSGESL